jgi:hypothetical protein
MEVVAPGYSRERLLCGTCGKMLTAREPDGADTERY